MFASLFSQLGVNAAFDDAVMLDARNGRVYRPFATLAATELGLPLTRPDGNPIGKPAFLRLAHDYREQVKAGATAGFRAWGKRAAVGVALDTIAVALDPSARIVGDAAAWEALKPQRKAKAAAAPRGPEAPAKGQDDAQDDAQDEGEDAAQGDTPPVALGVSLDDALPVVLDAIKAGALSKIQRALLVTALGQTSPVAALVLAGADPVSAEERAAVLADLGDEAMGDEAGPGMDLTGGDAAALGAGAGDAPATMPAVALETAQETAQDASGHALLALHPNEAAALALAVPAGGGEVDTMLHPQGAMAQALMAAGLVAH